MDDISLGALEQDAGGESPETTPDPNLPPLGTGMSDAGQERDPREEIEREQEEDERRALLRDAGSPADAAAMADAAVVLDATADARTVDAALLDAGHDGGADAGEEDSGPLDAGSDAQRSLLCTLEPWHCL